MTILQLVDDAGFNPDYQGPGSGADRKPVPRVIKKEHQHHMIETKDRIRKNLRCRVEGCGVDWAPQGVCGYCRQRVRELRACREARKAVA